MRIEPLPCNVDNFSYLLICEQTRSAAVVDPGEAYPVLSRLSQLQLELVSVLCTHHHQDHIGGVEDLVDELPHLSICCHGHDLERIAGANVPLKDGNAVRVGNLRGQVLHTPGHTRGSICYWFAPALFTGDTLFAGGCGRLFEGEAAQLYHALERIDALPEQTRCYYGHDYAGQNLSFGLAMEPENRAIAARLGQIKAGGAVVTGEQLAVERATNPFLRCTGHQLKAALAARGYDRLNDPVRVFTLLRELRNTF